MNEDLILDEILSLMMGVEGEYTIFGEFSIQNETYDELTKRILPLCQNYVKVENYIQIHSQISYGYVQHALCASLKEILQVIFFFVSLF